MKSVRRALKVEAGFTPHPSDPHVLQIKPTAWQRAAVLVRMASGLPLLLAYWIYQRSEGLFYTIGGPRNSNQKGRINWRHPFALPVIMLLAIASPILLAIAVGYQIAECRRRRRAAQPPGRLSKP